MDRKTITAISTPIGEGGISVIHVSGTSSIEIVNKIFRGKGIKDLSRAEDGRLYYGNIMEDGVSIDEVIINVSKKNDSFTGQDLVEINCHGGILATHKVLNCIKNAGAVEVNWQELTAQALRNNKMDSIQKEAVLELIKAKTTLAARVFLDQYKGALSTAIAECGLRISECQKQNNSAFPIPHSAIERLLKTADFGIALSHPLKVTIAGSANVGKSTLINALLGKERVIVHHEPGTTRDAVTDIISVDGIPLELTDTAGIRNTNDVIEGLAINETLRRLLATDIAVIVFDNSKLQNEDDLKIIKSLGIPPIPPFSKGGKGGFEVETIPVVNKIDLPSMLNVAELQPHFSEPICKISTLNGTGLPELKKRLVARFAEHIKYVPNKPVVFTERQKGLLLEAATALRLWQDKKSKAVLERVARAFYSLKLAFHHNETVINDNVMFKEHRHPPLSGHKLSLPYYRANL